MLQVFKSIPVAYDVHRMDALPEGTGPYARDSVTLGWEERVRSRGRRRSDAGVAFGTSLPRGAVLRAGDVFVLHELQLLVEVAEQQEPVLVVEPKTPDEWCLFGYYIGNSHQPLMIDDGVIVCADLPGMEQVLLYHAIPFSRSIRPFTPVGMAADALAAGHYHAPGQVS